MNWSELCEDSRLEDLPAKIELNKEGQIVVSPTQNRHGFFAVKIARWLDRLMVEGEVAVELAVETEDSTKVADVVWISPVRFEIIKNEVSCSVAPEICVEIRSPGNSVAEFERKRRLYLAAGAEEYWVCSLDGAMEFYGVDGTLERSRLCAGFPLQIEF